MKPELERGQIFGGWTVLGMAENDKHNKRQVRVRCECGEVRVKPATKIVRGCHPHCNRCAAKAREVRIGRKKPMRQNPQPRQPTDRQVAQSVEYLRRHAEMRVEKDFAGLSEREARRMAELYLQRAVTALQEGE